MTTGQLADSRCDLFLQKSLWMCWSVVFADPEKQTFQPTITNATIAASP